MTKKLLTCVVGANDVFINYPQHNKNYDVHHKKKILKKKYIFCRKKRCGVAKKKADRNTTQPITHVNSIPHTITLNYTKHRLLKTHIYPHYICFPPLYKKLIDNR
jgi:hypothetical protein